jgi:DNA-binding phage protein
MADHRALDNLLLHARNFVQDNHKKRRGERGGITLRAAAKRALQQVLRPLSEFVVDAGLSPSEINIILRESAVRIIAERQLEVARRVNISGIAASTGISRSEISRILKSSGKAARHRDDNRQQSTNSVLSAWHKEPRFTDPNGQPAELQLYGRGATFEALVKTHGRGIPTRAVLDELVRARAVEVLQTQRIRAKDSVAIHRGLDQQFIKMSAIGAPSFCQRC